MKNSTQIELCEGFVLKTYGELGVKIQDEFILII